MHRAIFRISVKGVPLPNSASYSQRDFQSSEPTGAHSRVRECMCHISPSTSFSEEHHFVRKLEAEMLREDPLPLTLSGSFDPRDSLCSQPPKPAGHALDFVLMLQFGFLPLAMFIFIVGRVMYIRPNSASAKQGPIQLTWPSLFPNGNSSCGQFSRPQAGSELCILIYALLGLHFCYWQKVSALLLETSSRRPPKVWQQVRAL